MMTLRRLRSENWSLTRELEELRVLRAMEQEAVPLLTGLATNRLFEQRLADELARSRRDHQLQGSLLALDINPARKHLLQDVVEVVRGAIRDTDVFCRLGGDEFMVLLPDTDAAQARVVMARLRVATIWAGSRQDVPVSISIGCSTWPADARVASQLIKKANRVMELEKRRLRGHARRRPPQGETKLSLVK